MQQTDSGDDGKEGDEATFQREVTRLRGQLGVKAQQEKTPTWTGTDAQQQNLGLHVKYFYRHLGTWRLMMSQPKHYSTLEALLTSL